MTTTTDRWGALFTAFTLPLFVSQKFLSHLWKKELQRQKIGFISYLSRMINIAANRFTLLLKVSSLKMADCLKGLRRIASIAIPPAIPPPAIPSIPSPVFRLVSPIIYLIFFVVFLGLGFHCSSEKKCTETTGKLSPKNCGMDVGSACSLEIGSSKEGMFEQKGDSDLYEVMNLVAGHLYHIEMTAAETIHFDGYLYSSTDLSHPVADNSQEAASFTYIVPAQAGGTYYISVQATGSSGPYSIVIKDLGEECPDRASNICTVAEGSAKIGRFHIEQDEDWYSFSLMAGQAYSITATANGKELAYMESYLYSATDSSQPVASDSGGYGKDAVFFYTVPAGEGAKSYYLRAASVEGSGDYSLSLIDLGEDPCNTGSRSDAEESFNSDCSIAPAPLEAASNSVNGNFQYMNDSDWYNLELAAGHIYHIQISNGSENRVPVDIDGYLHHSSDITTPVDNGGYTQDVSVNLRYAVPSEAGGNYLLRTHAADGHGSYSIVVTDLGLDCPDSAAYSDYCRLNLN